MEVTSEILPFFERDFESKPKLNNRNIISRFTFTSPHLNSKDSSKDQKPTIAKDEDGDYLVERKNSKNLHENVISLEHSVSTELSLVGLQIWRGALLLADFVIHSRDDFKGQTILELGAGVGLTSVVAGMFAKEIICTDINCGDILKLIQSNLERNKSIINAEISVYGLDFFDRNWPNDLEDKIKNVGIILAADVIYDNDVTEAFVETIIKILSIPPKKVLYIAMEKRYVFTISDLDSVAPCYEHLISCLENAKRKPPFSGWKIEQVPIDFPQYFNYERVKQLIMFRISS